MAKFIKLFLFVFCVSYQASSQSPLVFYIPNLEWEQELEVDSSTVFVTWCSTDFIIFDKADSSYYFCSSGVNYQIDDSTLSLAVESVAMWRIQKRNFFKLPQLKSIYSEAIFKKTKKWSKVEQLSIAENMILLNGVTYTVWNGKVNFNRLKQFQECKN
jgi:hypothetical protein